MYANGGVQSTYFIYVYMYVKQCSAYCTNDSMSLHIWIYDQFTIFVIRSSFKMTVYRKYFNVKSVYLRVVLHS